MNIKRTKVIPRSYVQVKRAKAGLGLFAKKPITPGMYLEYTGEIISTEEANELKGARYLFEINSRWTINGASRENLARYFNHSCDPNCESMQVGKHIFIKAIKSIPPGEELTCDYGAEYFNEFIKPKGCVCSACNPTKNCTDRASEQGTVTQSQ